MTDRRPRAGRGQARIRVAILSFAHPHAESYARILRDRDDVDVVGVDCPPYGADRGRLRGEALSATLGVPFLDDYSAALEWGPDAVIVTSETVHHAALVKAAAEAGADVLCEKPLATTLEDAESMQRAVDEAAVMLMTAYPVRFSPAFRALQESVRSGVLGEVIAVLGTNNGKVPALDTSWFGDRELAGGGALSDHVVHCADLIDELLSRPPVSVHAVTNSLLAPRLAVESAGLVTVVYEGGVIATIDCSWSSPPTSPSWGGLTLEVVGTRGTMTIDPFSQRVSGHDPDGAVWAPIGADLDALMLDEFLSAISERRQPQPDGGSGVRTLAIVAAAQRSVDTRGSVQFS
ncbi:Gfo/Idh/MocA family protein [Agromyces aerolatus]|uniref:Gfo/Idh/MocA family protein n=1 Tax=Agromyces sp. LY-1074 TaxID=3074080 RepID=UPI00286775F3|nr:MULTISPECIES: Gfo/Idh/MocA family oxidoreductase [unclassified Agromyces]MDR5700477.1 Gfo/Idh/MocA family oxidoreductase [Agromyces sp. LY-1074]MDR5706998.1 Gfo/Idh/MocA family oxidoreductase [Agromyces sp. LY-1358]